MKFYLNKDTLGQDSKGKHLFQIGFGLPFYFPLPDKVPFVSEGSDKFGSFGYILVCIKTKINTVLQSEEKYIGVHYNREKDVSYVEMVYLSSYEIKKTEFDDVISILLKILNSWLNAYSFLAYNTTSFTLNRMDLANIVPFRVINKEEDWDSEEPYFGFPNFNFEPKRNDINESQVRELVDYYRIAHSISSTNVFKTPELFCYDAIANIRNGQYKESVVNIQAGIESFLKILCIFLLKEDGKYNPNTIDNILGNFRNLIDHQIKVKLNANWDYNDNKNILGAYWENTYMLRNRIVHEGSDAISLLQCYNALNSALKFREEIISVVKVSNYKMAKNALEQLYFGRKESFSYKIVNEDEDLRIIYDAEFRDDFAKRLNNDLKSTDY